jgi:hypothetical protein
LEVLHDRLALREPAVGFVASLTGKMSEVLGEGFEFGFGCFRS